MTLVERVFVAHIVDCAKVFRWTSPEILASAQLHASLDPYQLSRLPDLLQAEIDKHRATRKETT